METPPELAQLARAHGVATEYTDDRGALHLASPDVLEAVLAALEVDTRNPGRALREHHEASWARLLGPVTVAWEGRGHLRVRVPANALPATGRLEIRLEGGELVAAEVSLSEEAAHASAEAGGRRYVEVDAPLPSLPLGYHDLTVEVGGTLARSRVIAAPRRAHRDASRGWGVFAPLFGLRSKESRGIGDLGDLRRLIDLTFERGGSSVATLPLLAAYLDEPFEPSPYSPVSRLAWNELYLELERAPGWAECAEARAVLAAPSEARALAEELRAPLVDYRRAAALRRPALEALARHAFESASLRRDLEEYARGRPVILDYARFRSSVERTGSAEHDARAATTEGSAALDTLDADARCHLYAQFALERQLTQLASSVGERGGAFYLDLPVGVHADGFDTWRYRGQFAMALDTGAPPDRAFPGGQNWAFPPLHPARSSAHGHEYFAASLRNHLRYAKRLRIDHVMALHRLFVFPHGSTEGTYLHMPAEELWAVLTLESQRAGAAIVGEDLGTVPPGVREAMREHGVGGIHVLEYEVTPDTIEVPPAHPDSVASIGTHDMPTLAAWLTGADIDARRRLGQSGGREAVEEHEERARQVEALRAAVGAEGIEPREVLEGCLAALGAGDAGLVLVSLDDLLGETESLNVPGTRDEHPNWRRRLPRTLEEIAADEDIRALLAVLERHRARR